MLGSHWMWVARSLPFNFLKPFFLKSYFTDANNLDIPDEVMDHPVLHSLGEATNDLVTWSNVSNPPLFHFHWLLKPFKYRTSFHTRLNTLEEIPTTWSPSSCTNTALTFKRQSTWSEICASKRLTGSILSELAYPLGVQRSIAMSPSTSMVSPTGSSARSIGPLRASDISENLEDKWKLRVLWTFSLPRLNKKNPLLVHLRMFSRFKIDMGGCWLFFWPQ